MKTIVALCVVAATLVAVNGNTYNPAYDNFDVKQIVGNSRVLKNYGKCFLDRGPCTAEGLDFKKIIPEALRTSCAKCTAKQREHVRDVVRAFQSQTPDIWNELLKKHDPNGEYTESFNKFLNGTD